MCTVSVFPCLSIYILPLSVTKEVKWKILSFDFSVRHFICLFLSNCLPQLPITPLQIVMKIWNHRTWCKRRKYTDLLFYSCFKMVALLWFFFAATGVRWALLLTELLVIYEVILCLAVSTHSISQSVVHLCTNGTSKAECESLN